VRESEGKGQQQQEQVAYRVSERTVQLEVKARDQEDLLFLVLLQPLEQQLRQRGFAHRRRRFDQDRRRALQNRAHSLFAPDSEREVDGGATRQ
jgi:hypothetical protein